jgi:hypothetical protein
MKVLAKTALAALAGAFLIALASAPAAQGFKDRDCSDFKTQKQAQKFFKKHNPRKDPHGLDGDHDGVACEDNPCPCAHRRQIGPAESAERRGPEPRRSGNRRKCGVLPGQGFYNYVKVRNVSCREAKRIGNKAGRKFCRHHGCNAQPLDDPDKGHVRVQGWRCKVKVGYESYQARCRKKNMSFLQRSGA